MNDNEKLEILSLKDFFKKIENLDIPEYQRPYRWNYKTANVLLNDIIEAKNKNIEKYRLGTIILHNGKDKDNKEKHYIVDGQQRLTTLSILMYCIDERLKLEKKEKKVEKVEFLLKIKYNDLSYKAININYNFYKKRINDIETKEVEELKNYTLNNCEVVKIITELEQEAFQFFDSQNNRGKGLNPHDLLKSYHLREMNNMNPQNKIDLINQWENYDQDDLANLFKRYLYPILRWYKKRDGLNFSDKKIDIFKGIKEENTNNYAIYHKASNLFVEQFNKNNNCILLDIDELNQYQLTQPIIAGKRFFYYVLHYTNLLTEIEKKMEIFNARCKLENKDDKNSENYDIFPEIRTGDKYIKELYENVLLFFADRFGLGSINDSIMKKIYVYCYSIRLSMEKIGLNTLNNYAVGEISPHAELENTDTDMAIFEKISEMVSPDEMNLFIVPRLTTKVEGQAKSRGQEHILDLVNKWNGQGKTNE